MAQEQRGFLHAPEEGKAFWFLGALVIIMLNSEQTENAFALQISTQPPGSAPNPRDQDHPRTFTTSKMRHSTFSKARQPSLAETRPGAQLLATTCSYHGGIVHTLKAGEATPLKLEIITSPGGPLGFEHFIEEMGEPAQTMTLPPFEPPDIQKLLTLATKYQIEFFLPT